jgi:hypothetical protein
VLMQSNLTNGDSMAVGQACLLTFALSSALAFAEGITPEHAGTYTELLAAVVERIEPDLLNLPPEQVKQPQRRKSRTVAPDVSRETAPAAVRDENVSVAEAAVTGLEVRLAASGHSPLDAE